MTASKQAPQRIQRKRTKGWRMPEGAVSVCRPSIWGNPFTIADCREAGFRGTDAELAAARKRILDNLPSLRGKDLACWCAPDQPCHADVLLRLANEVVA